MSNLGRLDSEYYMQSDGIEIRVNLMYWLMEWIQSFDAISDKNKSLCAVWNCLFFVFWLYLNEAESQNLLKVKNKLMEIPIKETTKWTKKISQKRNINATIETENSTLGLQFDRNVYALFLN